MGTFDFLNNVAPEKILDKNEFLPLKGAYLCRVDALEHRAGNSKKDGEPYDFYSLKLQVKETVEGDKGNNRFLDKIYSNDEKGITALRNDMFTAGLLEILNFTSNETLDSTSMLIKDKMVKIRAWNPAKVTKSASGEWEVLDKEDRVQRFKIVAEFELKGSKGSDKSAGNVPF